MQSIRRPALPRSATAVGFAASATVASAASSVFVFTPASPLVVDSNLATAAPSTASFNFTDAGGAPLSTQISFNVTEANKPLVTHDGSSYGDGGDPETFYFKYTCAVEASGGPKPSVRRLATNATVDATLVGPPLTTGSGNGAIFGNDWLGGGTVQGFAGFSYQDGFSSTALYGWAEFAYDQPSDSLALLSFGYDDSGAAAITPGSLTPYTAVPEPASAALGAALVAGSAALLQRRRRAVAAAA